MVLSINIMLYYIEKFCIFKEKFLLSLKEFEWLLLNTETGSSVATYNLLGNTLKN